MKSTENYAAEMVAIQQGHTQRMSAINSEIADAKIAYMHDRLTIRYKRAKVYAKYKVAIAAADELAIGTHLTKLEELDVEEQMLNVQHQLAMKTFRLIIDSETEQFQTAQARARHSFKCAAGQEVKANNNDHYINN